ncbi:MAG TPA: L,D-transpeptidase family protein [Ktedonobacterales bacterium]|nr:L,D-transpeptidase family protein [Ktedonobacterales bacterium]
MTYVFGVSLFFVSALLTACASGASSSAHKAQTRLDNEIVNARTNLHVPDGLLQPIQTQEKTIAARAANGSDKTLQAASASYGQLYNQVIAIEHMTPDQARAQSQADLKALTSALQHAQQAGYVEAAQYQARLQQAQQELTDATTTTDYFLASGYAEAQTAAIQMIDPVNKQLQAFDKLVTSQNAALGIVAQAPQPLECAIGDSGSYFWQNSTVMVTPPQTQQSPTYQYQQWPAQDLALFRAASSVQQYTALTALLQAQTQQLSADVASAIPQQASYDVQQFAADVKTYQAGGGTDTSFQQQASQDAQSLATAKSAAQYTALVKTVQKQRDAFSFPLLKVQTQNDLNALQKLVNQAQAIQTIDPANNQPYPDGYEYASQTTGIGDAQQRLANAQTADDYQAVDQEIQMMTTNLQALLTNLNDKTAVDQPHQTDLSLLHHYGLDGTRVMVVSLREQEARTYENGKFVKAFQVTTGNPDLPSPPGVHCIFVLMQNYDDISPFPKGSQYYYNPTHINYGMVYSDYGYIVHDAWWRSWFGKYSNLPHYDPISFNNGSHGCVNVPLDDMAWLFQWASYGTPVVVY